MNVYDFDETIYNGDSTRDFYLYTLKKHLSVIKYLPMQAFYFFLFVFGFITKTMFKEKFYSFFKCIKNIDSFVEEFWNLHQHNIKNWYIKNKKDDDTIISASPFFLLEPICKKLNITSLIASQVDKHTGKYTGENCYGEEKVKRLKEYSTYYSIDCFYSDSLSDTPLALIAKDAYIVKGDTLVKWKNYEMPRKVKLKKAFFSKEFFGFLLVGVINGITGIGFSMIFSVYFHPNIAFVIGYILALIISYILNSKLIFKNKMSLIKYFKFCVSYIPNFLIQNVCVTVLYNWLHINELLTFIISAALGVPITFLFIKLFAFKPKK